MRKLQLAIMAVGLAGLPGLVAPAQAGFINVKEIEVRSTYGTYIQIAEVIATQTGTGSDVALASAGATASASSVETGAGTSAVIDGVFPSSYPNIFHSVPGYGQFLNVALSTRYELDSITLYGRSDCCGDRDVFDVQLFDQSRNLLFSYYGANANNAGHSVTIDLPNTATVPEPTPFLAGALLLLPIGAITLRKLRRKQAV